MNSQHELRIILTSFCNYRCFFCHAEGMPDDSGPLLISPADYGFITGTLKQFFGWNTVTLTGGEPLLSPIYLATCKAIAEKCIRITTVTNGSLISSPKKLLPYNRQVNISLHTLDTQKYHQITGSHFPPQNIVSTVKYIRQTFSDMIIHLNVTVIKGLNDNLEELRALLDFAHSIRGTVKLIDLASNNSEMVVSVARIMHLLSQLGFTVVRETLWQIFLSNGEDEVMITRCGFASAHQDLELRNLLLKPDGCLSLGSPVNSSSVDIMPEVQRRDALALAQKVADFFPPLQSVTLSCN